MKKSSMADVARLAGVSTATVSHVINRSRFVSDEVTQRVESAIRRLNYIPNQMARNLKTGRNHTVLFIVPDIANSFFSTAIEAVESVLVGAGYRLVIANTKEDLARETVHLQGAGNGTIDGLLLASTAGRWEQISALLPAGLPTVLVDRVFSHAAAALCGRLWKHWPHRGMPALALFQALQGFLPPKNALPPTGRQWLTAACPWRRALFKPAIPCAAAARNAVKSFWRLAAPPLLFPTA